MSRIAGDLKTLLAFCKQHTHLFFFMMNSKGRMKSFWNRKFGSSPRSRNFTLNCRNESTANMAISSLLLQPA
jgi:hypothetical protein